MEKLEPSHIAGVSVNSAFGKQLWQFLKMLKIDLPYDSAVLPDLPYNSTILQLSLNPEK